MREVVLASGSPRRRTLLEEAGVPHRVLAVDVDEAFDPFSAPEELVRRLAERKARAAAAILKDGLILAADTVVVLDDEILGKPATPREARATLSRLSGRTHRVLTGYCVLNATSGRMRCGHQVTEVTFRPLAAEEIATYVEREEPLDKAGAYGIQEGAKDFVAGVSGSLDNVIGLPVAPALELLSELS